MGCCGGRLTSAENYKAMEKKIKAMNIPAAHAEAWARFFADGLQVSEFAIDNTDLKEAHDQKTMKAKIAPMIVQYKANVEAIFADVFQKHDKDKNGFLDKNEFKAVLVEWVQAQSAALTHIIDGIGNAFVDKSMQVINDQSGGGAGGPAGIIVTSGQENLVRMKINAHLNQMESRLRARLTEIETHIDQYAAELFAKLDTDKTGKISLAVFIENNRKPFAELLNGGANAADPLGEAFNPQRYDVDNLARH